VARTRLRRLAAAGLIDSFGLALGWTTFTLLAVKDGGLDAVGFYGSALLIGVALSAPVASALARRFSGRRLLRTTAVVEGALRLVSLVALVAGAPMAVVGICVALMGTAAWTGFAAMRAEVAATSTGAGGMTRYLGLIAAVEAAGAAVAALLPEGVASTLTGPGFDIVLAVYVLSLVPTFVVASGAVVVAAPRVERRRRTVRMRPLGGGFLVMAVGSAPTFLAIGLAAELYGRTAVALSAGAFTVGAIAAPYAAAFLERRRVPAVVLWPLLGAGMAAGWAAAPWHLAGLAFAQLLSGVALSAFEGTMDDRVARAHGTARTADLARSGAARALGSAVALGAAPTLISALGLTVFSLLAAGLLIAAGLAAVVFAGFRERSDDPDAAISMQPAGVA
jgi:hypothetical protein